MPWEHAGVERFRREFSGGRVVPMKGAYYFYNTNRDLTLEILQEAFLHIS